MEQGGKQYNFFILTLLFNASKRWDTTKKCENKNYVIFYFNLLFADVLDKTG